MKHILKPAFSLFLIAAVSTVLLGFVRNITLEPIANQRKKTLENTMKTILGEASVFNKISGEKNGNITAVYEGRTGDTVVGYVVELAAPGYSGDISMMVGISGLKDEVSGMRILRHTETPGLGAQAVRPEFFRKYDGRALVPLNVVRSSPGVNDIEAITSATITTRAVTGAVNEAIEWYKKHISGAGRR